MNETDFPEKVKWLKRRGYEQTVQGDFQLTIIVKNERHQGAYFTSTLSFYDVVTIPIEGLESFNNQAWQEARIHVEKLFEEVEG